MLDNIPIYRAKKIDSDEYVEGFLYQDIICYIPSNEVKSDEYKKALDEESWFIMDNMGRNEMIAISTLAIHHPNMLAQDSDRYFSNGEKDLRVFASLQLEGKGGDLVGYVDGHINYKVAERYVISEDGVLFLRDIIPSIKKYTLDKEIASWYKIYGIQQ
jgi:hypothetical protein